MESYMHLPFMCSQLLCFSFSHPRLFFLTHSHHIPCTPSLWCEKHIFGLPLQWQKDDYAFLSGWEETAPISKTAGESPIPPRSWLVAPVFPCKLIMGRPLPPTHPRHPTQVLSKVLLSTYKSLNTRHPSEGSHFPLLPLPSPCLQTYGSGSQMSGKWTGELTFPFFTIRPSQKVPLGSSGSSPIVICSPAMLLSKPPHTALYICQIVCYEVIGKPYISFLAE